METSFETIYYETQKKGKHKKSSKDRGKRKRYYLFESGSSSDSNTKFSDFKLEDLWLYASEILKTGWEGSSEANSQVTLMKGKDEKSSKGRRKRRKCYSSESGRSSDPDTQSSETEINKSKMAKDGSSQEINKSKMVKNGFSEEINKSEMETGGTSAAHHSILEKGKHLSNEELSKWIEILSTSSSDSYSKVSAESDMSSSSGI